MEVLKSGKSRRNWSGTYVCTGSGSPDEGCDAKLRVSLADLFRTYSVPPGEPTSYATFMCPECGVFTDVCDSDGGGDPWAACAVLVETLPALTPAMLAGARRRVGQKLPYAPPHALPTSHTDEEDG